MKLLETQIRGNILKIHYTSNLGRYNVYNRRYNFFNHRLIRMILHATNYWARYIEEAWE